VNKIALLEIGSELPSIEAFNHNGNKINLRDFIGKPTVIYFYPMDDTPGCTKEACSFRDNISKFKGVNVVGISTQGVESHQKFVKKYNLNFTLIADKDKKISKKFGVLKSTGFARRTTFIFDENGILKFVYLDVNPEGHAVEVLNKLKELKLLK
jgi:peroxiredoxin Q/BCP